MEPKQVSDNLQRRREVCFLIEKGATNDALEVLMKNFPEALHINPVDLLLEL